MKMFVDWLWDKLNGGLQETTPLPLRIATTGLLVLLSIMLFSTLFLIPPQLLFLAAVLAILFGEWTFTDWLGRQGHVGVGLGLLAKFAWIFANFVFLGLIFSTGVALWSYRHLWFQLIAWLQSINWLVLLIILWIVSAVVLVVVLFLAVNINNIRKHNEEV